MHFVPGDLVTHRATKETLLILEVLEHEDFETGNEYRYTIRTPVYGTARDIRSYELEAIVKDDTPQ